MTRSKWMWIFIKEHWLIISAISLLVGAFIVLMLVVPSQGAATGLAKYSLVAEIMGALILLFTLISVYIQVVHIRGQNELQRNVASKSAIQALNEVLLDEKQEDFLLFVVPDPEEGKARQIMMAFSLMNSLELLYLAQKDNVSREDFKRLLRGFTGNVRVHWKDSFPTVYHPEFQKIVKEVFDEMAKEEVAKVLARFEEQGLRTRGFPTLKEAQVVRRSALESGDYAQALTINLGDYSLPKVFVVRVVGKDEKVAVSFQDGTTLPLDVLRRGGEQGEAIPSPIEDEI